MSLVEELVELYRKVSTELPKDVEKVLRAYAGHPVIDDILENVRISREEHIPMCQDTGTPIWYVRRTADSSEKELKEAINTATGKATLEVPLRENSVCPVAGKSFGNVPVVHFEEWDKDFTRFDLLLKGGGSENVGTWYKLPDSTLSAGRDLEGVGRCVVDAVKKAGASGCPPYFLGVCIGGPGDEVAHYSKKMLLRKIDDTNKNPEAGKLEGKLMEELKGLDIGPMGLGGKPSVLGVKIGVLPRHPASYFVDVSFSCWALRRGEFEWKE